MSKNQVSRNRKIGAVVAYTTLACSLVSLGVYVYRQQQQKGTATRRNNNNNHNGNSSSSGSGNGSRSGQNGGAGAGQDRNNRASLDYSGSNNGREGSSEAQSSSLSRLGSKIARTVKRNRKVMTISLKNTIVWNPSPDPTTPNYGFVEGAIPLLFHLAENFNLHLILLCPPLPQHQQQQHQQRSSPLPQANGKGRVPTLQEQDELKHQQQLGQDRDREQILTMLRNAGLITPPGSLARGGGPKLIDPRQLLVCETEEGVSHMVRHLESQVHVEAQQTVLEMVQGVVPMVVFVQKRPGHSRASSTAREQQQDGQTEDIMTRSHARVRSASRTSSSGSSSSADEQQHQQPSSSSQILGDSFVEIVRSSSSSSSSGAGTGGWTHTPVVSGFVTQAGKKGYVEVTDQLMRSSLNPEYSN